MSEPMIAPKVVLTVGNNMMGDDGAGPLLAELMEANSIDGWVVINGGSAPENVSYQVRELQPQCVVIVDAADIGLNPGEIRVIDPDYIAEMFIMSTHNMPLNFLIDQLKADIAQITFLGIQPDIVGFYYPMTEAVKKAVDEVYQGITSWRTDYFPALEIDNEADIEQ